MNYLAHAYLSFGRPEFLVGNMISDLVKGRKKFTFLPGIQDGMDLHRAIDAFTDAHHVTKRAADIFKPYYRLYSGAFVDIVYDHFLANDRTIFPGQASLEEFSKEVYDTLSNYTDHFPAKFNHIFYYMQMQDWLSGYSLVEGIEKSFGGLVRRARFLDDHKTAYKMFLEHYDELGVCYSEFFPELEQFAKAFISDLEKK